MAAHIATNQQGLEAPTAQPLPDVGNRDTMLPDDTIAAQPVTPGMAAHCEAPSAAEPTLLLPATRQSHPSSALPGMAISLQQEPRINRYTITAPGSTPHVDASTMPD